MYDNDDVAYAQGRLNNTIIRYDGKAVIVQAVNFMGANRPLLVSSKEVLGGKLIEADIDKYDGTPVPLGFVNYGSEVGYIERKPMRHDWRQGLRAENCFFPLRPLRANCWSVRNIAKTIEGKFSTIEKAIDEAEEEEGTVAFHRHFAVDQQRNLIYRTFGKVGQIARDKTYLLDAKFGWVEDRLRAVL